jgi:hypothetical protein
MRRSRRPRIVSRRFHERGGFPVEYLFCSMAHIDTASHSVAENVKRIREALRGNNSILLVPVR